MRPPTLNHTHGRGARILLAVNNSPRSSITAAWLLFLAGLFIYFSVQGALTIAPLTMRSYLPWVDDSVTYILKTRQMEECFFQDCPALNDLRQQLLVPSADPAVARQRFLAASKIFPVYHPLLSLIMLGLSKLGLSLTEAYRVIWCLGPFFFGLAFAYLLTALFGLPVAGLTLMILAFKVLPQTGLHRIVPSNLAMGLAVIIWARLVSRRGDAPWSTVLGSLALMGLHPIGRIYSVMAAALALTLVERPYRRRILCAVAAVGVLVAVSFIIPMIVKRPLLFNPAVLPGGDLPVWAILQGAFESLKEVIAVAVRLSDGLFGSLPIFCGAVVLGLVSLPAGLRPPVVRLLAINLFFVCALFFYVSSHPADVILRLWIPTVVIIFALVGQALWYSLSRTWTWVIDRINTRNRGEKEVLMTSWPPVLLALLLGYCLHMIVLGGEQVITIAQFMGQRQPLSFSQVQPRLLLSEAKPGDRVLYTSFTIMPYYFIHGAMRFGAVYYHPSFQDAPVAREWLNRPDLHFAVTYNPFVYHPTFQEVDEHRWWRTTPTFHFSPLDKPRKYVPLAREGKLVAADFHWLEVRVNHPEFPKLLRVWIDNPGDKSEMRLTPRDHQGELLEQRQIVVSVPARWSGWMEQDLAPFGPGSAIRITFPQGAPLFSLGGLRFDAGPLMWPWVQRAQLTLLPKDYKVPITVSFDPSSLLPAPLNRRKILVLDDQGSSVLLKIRRE